MVSNDELKIHCVNVNHGDATIIEFPDYGVPARARFGVVDFGGKKAADRERLTAYLDALLLHRGDGAPGFDDYSIEFACVTHPHDDHYGGLSRFLDRFANHLRQFWDCGFRTNAVTYNRLLATPMAISRSRITIPESGL